MISYYITGDKVTISDPEGTFDASSKLTPASDILLLAAGSGRHWHIELLFMWLLAFPPVHAHSLNSFLYDVISDIDMKYSTWENTIIKFIFSSA